MEAMEEVHDTNDLEEEVHDTKHLETLEEYYLRMSTEVQNWTRRKNKRSCPPPSPPSSVSAEEAYEDDNGSAFPSK